MALYYKLRIIGVPTSIPSQILRDNESVLTSCYIASSILNNNHNNIAYHQVKETVSAGVISLIHIPVKI